MDVKIRVKSPIDFLKKIDIFVGRLLVFKFSIMKKNIILVSLFLLMILVGCSVDFNNEKDKKDVYTKNQVESKENDLFENKQKCISYKGEIEKSMINFINKSHESQNLDNDINKGTIKLQLGEVFYSKSLNSCIFGFSKIEDLSYFLKEKGYSHDYYIVDYLNNKILFNTYTNVNFNTICFDENRKEVENCNNFEYIYITKIKKFKGE